MKTFSNIISVLVSMATFESSGSSSESDVDSDSSRSLRISFYLRA